MYRKFIYILAGFLVLVFLVGCGQQTPDTGTAPTTTDPTDAQIDTGVEEIDELEQDLDDSDLEQIEKDLDELDW